MSTNPINLSAFDADSLEWIRAAIEDHQTTAGASGPTSPIDKLLSKLPNKARGDKTDLKLSIFKVKEEIQRLFSKSFKDIQPLLNSNCMKWKATLPIGNFPLFERNPTH